jgi:ubiquinone/menaquinone biosynthesis C-methylase UbiE
METDHFINIYRHHAVTYQELIAFEDVDGNLPRLLQEITPFSGKAVLDLGSGTGRFPQIFPHAGITCLDLHMGMLQESRRQRDLAEGNWKLLQGDGRRLPFPDSSFEVITAGWAFGHFVGWFPQDWKFQINRVLAEAIRVSIPGGTVIILETMTTGALQPSPPTPGLAEYYQHLEEDHGFTRQVIQTDYIFENLEQACYYMQFFFGDELVQKVKENNWVRLPEWSGVWSKRL